MPAQDGTGPAGQGPMTGRGMGPCGAGMQRGFGRGRGFGMGFGRRVLMFDPLKLTNEQEKKSLKQNSQNLKQRKRSWRKP